MEKYFSRAFERLWWLSSEPLILDKILHKQQNILFPHPVESYTFSQSDFVGRMPIRQDLEVIPANNTDLHLGWVVEEHMMPPPSIDPSIVNRLTFSTD